MGFQCPVHRFSWIRRYCKTPDEQDEQEKGPPDRCRRSDVHLIRDHVRR